MAPGAIVSHCSAGVPSQAWLEFRARKEGVITAPSQRGSRHSDGKAMATIPIFSVYLLDEVDPNQSRD